MKIKLLISISLFLCSQNSFSQRSFSHEAWTSIDHIYQQILTHPFNQELASGKLDAKKFTFYKEQDALYLIQFSKVLKILSTKLLKIDDKIFMQNLSANIAHDEADSQLPKTSSITLANFAYIQFLLLTAQQDQAEEILASILPCFWIYEVLAKELKKQMNHQTPYRGWIDYYSSKKYHGQVEKIIQITDRQTQGIDLNKRKKLLNIFRTATALELRFWDDAYNLRKL